MEQLDQGYQDGRKVGHEQVLVPLHQEQQQVRRKCAILVALAAALYSEKLIRFEALAGAAGVDTAAVAACGHAAVTMDRTSCRFSDAPFSIAWTSCLLSTARWRIFASGVAASAADAELCGITCGAELSNS